MSQDRPTSNRGMAKSILATYRLIILSGKSKSMGALGALLIVAVVAAIIIGIAYWFFYGRGPSR